MKTKQSPTLTQPTLSNVRLMSCLWSHISPRRRRQLVLLLGLTMVSSLAEVISLGSVMPFIGIITQPEKVFTTLSLFGILQVLGITSAVDLVLPITIAFAIAALSAGGLRLLLHWVSLRLGNILGADIGIEVYRRTLYQPYSVHIARSSSEIISGITQKAGAATGVLVSVLTSVTSAAVFVTIMVTLLAIDSMMTIVAAGSFGAAYGMIVWRTRQRLMRNSQRYAQEQTHVIKALQEGLGAIRDVLLDGAQPVYCDVYRRAVMSLQRATVQNSFIIQAPRFALEALGMVLIAFVAMVMSNRPGGVETALPIIGMLALGAQRLLPLMQQLYGNLSGIAGNMASLIDVLGLLEQPLPAEADQPEPEPLVLKETIRFENVHFRYGNSGPWVLVGINLVIFKGARIGLVGRTGCGKSTALDLLMGLLEPTQGRILVDGQPISRTLQRAWQRVIAHVPQNIYLADTNIAENIAFGIPPEKIDIGRVRRAAEQALLAEFIESRPEGYRAIVGERGIRLSGGQRQRIGIARALYKQASVLVFDEATSALDDETEQTIMQTIEGLSEDLTILIIAHRLTTLKKCTQIVELGDGGIKRIGTYQEIINK
jgi:ATP-binding cassette, subfamily B, bacterial PglK